ncbi:MAG TPA: T9SS type A sorting domain-containing protein, partial [Saprospiraceae bacterium]|nr:T9SS type A sorting domain-containing protein [Saprospiraceae bacterium]
DGSTEDLEGDDDDDVAEGYWWAVTAGTGFDDATDNNLSWYDWEGDLGTNEIGNAPRGFTLSDLYDLDGTDNQDDDDLRYGSFGYWQYTQHIVVYDDTDPTAEIDVDAENCTIASDCLGDVDFTITVGDACSTEGISVSAVLNGSVALTLTDNGDGTYSGTITDGPLGKHTITATVNDGCGNVTTVSADLEIIDCKGPAPICHDGIVVELMPTEDGAGMAEVWASDLIASPINDCTALSNDASGFGEVPVEAYSIFLNDGFVSYDTAVANTDDQTGIFFDCTDAGTEPMVRVYAEDEAGNVDYCLTFVRVQDNNSVCAPAAGGSIAGAVATETAANVEGVEVQLSGARSMMYMTDASGSFGFNNLAQGGDYTVTPQKDLNHLNGVSTFDLVLISKHILGVSQLDSPYKMIAADVNNSQSITTLDLIQLRKLILNIDTEFANNTSWRFIDKSHVFTNPSNPWATAIPEFKNINNLDANAEAEFVATKIGDVNGSATVEARAATGEFAINTAEQAMIAGNEYTIDFSADMTDIAGYQFTLDVANAEIVDVVYGAAKAENFGVFTKEGVITTSFNGDAAGTLFSVVVRATADAKVSESVQISSRYTAAEAYSNDAEQLNVNLNIAGATATEAAFALNQNTPNPFQGETQIGFNLPEAQEATITLQDVAGRTVKMIEGDFAKGYNQVTIGANDLPSAGVYFYTLTAGDKSATKKLILVDALNR